MQKTEQTFDLAFAQNPLPMWVVDRETMRILEVNDAALAQYGYSHDEFCALSLPSIRPPDDLPRFHERWRQVNEASAPGKSLHVGLLSHRRKDGTDLTVDVTATPITHAGRAAFLSVAVDITGHLRVEEEAREARERFEFISRAVNDTIWDLNLITGEVWRSGNRGAVFDKGPGEVAPRMEGWSELIHPQDRDRVLESLHAVVRSGGKTWASEYRFRRGDGSWGHMLDRAFVVHDETGRAVRMVGSMIDISDRKRVDQELLDQRRRLKAIFDNTQNAVLITNFEDRFLDVNPAACELFGYTREELLSLEIWDLILAELDTEYRGRIRQLLQTGHQEADGQARRKDGTVVEVEYRSVANIEPGVHLTIMRDITQRKRAEQELLQQNRRLQALFDNATDGIVLTNDEGRYVDANPAACALFGYSREELCTFAVWDLVVPGESQKLRDRFRRLLETGRLSGEARRVRKDGRIVELEFRSVANIEPGLHLAMMRDISQQKRDEESLRSLSGRLLRLQDEERRRLARELHDSTAQRLAALALELAVVHDRGGRLSARGRQALAEAGRIADECSRELRTLSYLLHPPLLDEMGLASALSGYVEGFSKRSGIRVKLDMPADIGRLPAETETTLFRIVQECLTNVHRHSMSPVAQVRLVLDPEAIQLEIADQGRGLAAGVTSGGTNHGTNGATGERHELGVGIAGMKERVRQLGGNLDLDSSEAGLTVRAFLPRRQP